VSEVEKVKRSHIAREYRTLLISKMPANMLSK